MRKGFLIYEELRKYFPVYEEAVSHLWLCDCSILNFLIYEEKFILFFISVVSLDCPAAYGAVLAGGGGGAGGMQVGRACHCAVVRQAAHLLPVVSVNNDPASQLRGVHVLLCHLKPVPLYSIQTYHTRNRLWVLMLTYAYLCQLMLSKLSTSKFVYSSLRI